MSIDVVLDASALIAYLKREKGYQALAPHLSRAMMSSVNYHEVVYHFVRTGAFALEEISALLQASPIEIVPFTATHAIMAASLAPLAEKHGLSLGDRACLALALDHGATVFTADSIWAKLGLKGITIHLIR